MWITSSFCTQGECVEVGIWRKSSSSFSNSNCVEVAGHQAGDVLVRDTKDRSGPVLRFTRDEWIAFTDGVKAGEFDVAG